MGRSSSTTWPSPRLPRRYAIPPLSVAAVHAHVASSADPGRYIVRASGDPVLRDGSRREPAIRLQARHGEPQAFSSLGGRPRILRWEVHIRRGRGRSGWPVRCVVSIIFIEISQATNTDYLLLALQFAKLSGFTNIIATASLRNSDLLHDYGATHVIDRTLPEEKIVEQVKAIVGGPVDISYDAVSTAETTKLSVAVLKPDGGRLVYVFFGQGALIAELTAGKNVEAVCARGLQTSERNLGALASLYAKLPELIKEKALKVSGPMESHVWDGY